MESRWIPVISRERRGGYGSQGVAGVIRAAVGGSDVERGVTGRDDGSDTESGLGMESKGRAETSELSVFS